MQPAILIDGFPGLLLVFIVSHHYAWSFAEDLSVLSDLHFKVFEDGAHRSKSYSVEAPWIVHCDHRGGFCKAVTFIYRQAGSPEDTDQTFLKGRSPGDNDLDVIAQTGPPVLEDQLVGQPLFF